jgi:hypothetical protein
MLIYSAPPTLKRTEVTRAGDTLHFDQHGLPYHIVAGKVRSKKPREKMWGGKDRGKLVQDDLLAADNAADRGLGPKNPDSWVQVKGTGKKPTTSKSWRKWF